MSRRRAHRPKYKSPYLWHRYMGLTVALFALLLAGTGILLNHTDDLGLDRRYVQLGWLLDWYQIHTPQTLVSYPVGEDQRLTLMGRHLYLDTRELEGEYGELIGAAATNGLRVAGVDGDLLLLTESGELIEDLDGADGVPAGMQRLGLDPQGGLVVAAPGGLYQPDADFLTWTPWSGDAGQVRWAEPGPLPGPLRTELIRRYRGEVLPWERVVLDLHSGRLFGRYGALFMDAVAVLMIALALTGTWIWLRRRGRR